VDGFDDCTVIRLGRGRNTIRCLKYQGQVFGWGS